MLGNNFVAICFESRQGYCPCWYRLHFTYSLPGHYCSLPFWQSHWEQFIISLCSIALRLLE